MCSVILENQSCRNCLDAVNSWYGAEKEELTEQMQHIATESKRTVTELYHQLAKLQLQVEEAEEARRRESKTLE